MSSDISSLLNQRGHKVTAEGSERDIFLPIRQGLEPQLLDSFKDVLYNLMRGDSFRRSLRDWAYGRISDENPSPNLPYIKSYEKLCEKFGGWSSAPQEIQHRYACTFEWYISELLRRQFAARASGFSLRLKDADPGDEFDCIALLDDGLVFVECKTGGGAIYAQIKKFLRRDAELEATYSFFVFDRDYTFRRDGDDAPRLSAAEAYELGIDSINKITVGSHTFFQILGQRTNRGIRYLFACSAYNGFEERIRYMIRYVNETRNRPVASSLFGFESIPFVSDADDNLPTQPDQANTVAEPDADLATPEEN